MAEIDYGKIAEQCMEMGFSKAALLNIADLDFKLEVRKMCEDNRCGAYGRNWCCPPGCGTIEECAQRARQYSKGVLVEYIGKLEDSFDIEGMEEASKKYKELFDAMAEKLKAEYGSVLGMGAGGCTRCEKCTYPEEKCRFPDRAYASMEACGLLVSEVCKACGVPYINGVNTVTYVGCFLIRND